MVHTTPSKQMEEKGVVGNPTLDQEQRTTFSGKSVVIFNDVNPDEVTDCYRVTGSSFSLTAETGKFYFSS